MVARPLGRPSASVTTGTLAVRITDPAKLIRISSYKTVEPYFGSSGANRFDAPGCATGKPEFSTCYFGLTLPVAIAETVLHDEIAVSGRFRIPSTILAGKQVLRFAGSKLRLANLTGAHLKKLNGHADLSGTVDFAITQQWSLAVFNNPGRFDGFLYMSRHLNTQMAVILYDRAAPKVQVAAVSSLLATTGYAEAAQMLGIVGI